MIRANRPDAQKKGVSIANDSRESRCESPVPLRFTVIFGAVEIFTPPPVPEMGTFAGHGVQGRPAVQGVFNIFM